MPKDTGDFLTLILTILVALIPVLVTIIYRLSKRKKHFYDEYQKIISENEKMNYYLRYKIPDDSIVRYQNNMAYFKNSNFDSELIERRLLQEISRLRQDVKSISDLKFKLESNIDNGNSPFDYQEFILNFLT